jgi:hypothetical protein
MDKKMFFKSQTGKLVFILHSQLLRVFINKIVNEINKPLYLLHFGNRRQAKQTIVTLGSFDAAFQPEILYFLNRCNLKEKSGYIHGLLLFDFGFADLL